MINSAVYVINSIVYMINSIVYMINSIVHMINSIYVYMIISIVKENSAIFIISKETMRNCPVQFQFSFEEVWPLLWPPWFRPMV